MSGVLPASTCPRVPHGHPASARISHLQKSNCPCETFLSQVKWQMPTKKAFNRVSSQFLTSVSENHSKGGCEVAMGHTNRSTTETENQPGSYKNETSLQISIQRPARAQSIGVLQRKSLLSFSVLLLHLFLLQAGTIHLPQLISPATRPGGGGRGGSGQLLGAPLGPFSSLAFNML